MGVARQGMRVQRRHGLSQVKHHKRAFYNILSELDRVYDKMLADDAALKLYKVIGDGGSEDAIAGPVLDYVEANSELKIGEMELYYLIQKIMAHEGLDIDEDNDDN
tara:strand:- start:120 stop:437 length:318 start_codon:yes stop_codon:yes gene_type:complete